MLRKKGKKYVRKSAESRTRPQLEAQKCTKHYEGAVGSCDFKEYPLAKSFRPEYADRKSRNE
jgi:hypothetical protein